MPRGNDPDAIRELASRHGVGGGGNAEDLVQANRMRYSNVLRKAQLIAPDDEASKDLKLDQVAKDADEDSGSVVSAAVHGDYVIYVVEAPDGNYRKGAYASKGSRADKRGENDEDLSAADRQAHVEAAQVKAAREAQAEAEEKSVKAQEEAAEKARAEATKAREAAQKDQEKASKAATK